MCEEQMQLQQEIDDLKGRVRALEQRGTGPRGPAGDITQAVSQATMKATLAAEKTARATLEDLADRFRGPKGEAGPPPSPELLDTLIVSVLHDYHILTDGQVGQLLRYEVRKAVAAELANKQ